MWIILGNCYKSLNTCDHGAFFGSQLQHHEYRWSPLLMKSVGADRLPGATLLLAITSGLCSAISASQVSHLWLMFLAEVLLGAWCANAAELSDLSLVHLCWARPELALLPVWVPCLPSVLRPYTSHKTRISSVIKHPKLWHAKKLGCKWAPKKLNEVLGVRRWFF